MPPRGPPGGPTPHRRPRRAAPGARGSEENIGEYACSHGRRRGTPARRGQQGVPPAPHHRARDTHRSKAETGRGTWSPAALLSQLPIQPSQAQDIGGRVFSGRHAQRVQRLLRMPRTARATSSHGATHSACTPLLSKSRTTRGIAWPHMVPALAATNSEHAYHTTGMCY